jgi:hypothetical protein
MRLRFLIAFCLATLAAAPAAAQLVNENLLVTMPDGYKVGFSTKKNNMIMNEMVPAAETVENWTEMVTVQIFLGMKGVSPDQFRANMEKLWFGACAKASSHPIASAVENGYPASVWLMSCPLNAKTGKPEITWFKAIRGNDSFYVVQKAFRFEPSKEQVVTWTGYLKKVSVCDSRLPDRACLAVRR